MKYFSIYKLEKKFTTNLIRFLLGPSAIVDGLVRTITFGFVSTSLELYVARQLARSRSNFPNK